MRKLSAIDPLLYSVQTALFDGLARGQVSLADVTRSTGTSARTLRRRLSGLGTSFHEQRDKLRHELAVQQLRLGQESVARIGDRLGFAGTNAFQRAFRRWTGVAPSTFRQRERVADE
jgi:AraC-like DNA-binding protein